MLVVLSPAASKEQLLRAYVDAWVMRASLQDVSINAEAVGRSPGLKMDPLYASVFAC